MSAEDYGPHPSHCCARHGCKYGASDCSVVTGKVAQDYACEQNAERERCFPLLTFVGDDLEADRFGNVTVSFDDGSTATFEIHKGSTLRMISNSAALAVLRMRPRMRRR